LVVCGPSKPGVPLKGAAAVPKKRKKKEKSGSPHGRQPQAKRPNPNARADRGADTASDPRTPPRAAGAEKKRNINARYPEATPGMTATKVPDAAFPSPRTSSSKNEKMREKRAKMGAHISRKKGGGKGGGR